MFLSSSGATCCRHPIRFNPLANQYQGLLCRVLFRACNHGLVVSDCYAGMYKRTSAAMTPWPCMCALFALLGMLLVTWSASTSQYAALSTFGRSKTVHHNRLPQYEVFGEARTKWMMFCAGLDDEQLCKLPNVWLNCSGGIYLDVGTNVGVQLRKLYNAEQFPNARVLPFFDKTYGLNRSNVCSLGVEPNPHHAEYLHQLNLYFKRKGYQSLILTNMAVSVKPGRAKFFLDTKSPNEWGASLSKGVWQKNGNNTDIEVNVDLLPLPLFLLNVIRPIMDIEASLSGRVPPLMMKLDVEGAEYSLLPGLLLTGTLCDMDVLCMEPHSEAFRNEDGVNMTIPDMLSVFHKMRKAHPTCRVSLVDLDDETYFNGTQIPLPP